MKLIAAVDRNNGIGRKDGSLLFHIPEDMARFRALTVGETVIMGRKTLESLPDAKPLPNRMNIVLTRDKNYRCAGAAVCCGVVELRELCERLGGEKYVIGGGEIYRLLMPLCDTAYITRIDSDGKGEIFMPPFTGKWRLTHRSDSKEYNGLRYWFETYTVSMSYPSCLVQKP